ncbi:MAG: D-2-hydroxyacid dehydrogenase [Oscillospiraceae bacterium]|nr:D-2-hydroxyacid dehydrogenase [Oscillospiraceae bacterium]
MNIMILDRKAIDRDDLDYSKLKTLGNLIIKDDTSQENLIDEIKDVDAVLTNRLVFRRDVIEKLPRLKYIGLFATGYNGVDLDAASDNGITVTNVPGYSTNSVAQQTFALILELCNKVGAFDRDVKSGIWTKKGPAFMFTYGMSELCGKTIGIVGFGDIGIKVAEIAQAFGMNILVYSRTKKPQYENDNLKFTSLDELLQNSDFVTLHTPLTDETRSMIGANEFAKMKKSAYIINTARGAVIEQDALIKALSSEQIAGGAVDVMVPEPPPLSSPLYKCPNLIITPHIAWATIEARTRLLNVVYENLKSYIEGNPQNKVNR